MGEMNKVTVGIVGASGYGGVQLVRLLMDHPGVEIVYLGGDSSAGKEYSELYRHLTGKVDQKIEPVDPAIIGDRCQIVFLAMPNGLAYPMVPTLLEKGCQVLDLSADYRFSDLETYKSWYGGDRDDHDLAEMAVYGLPELYRDRLKTAKLVGCPGCYPTASLLALAPLVKQGLLVPGTAIIDAKSGTSGGGRQAKTHLLMAEAGSSVSPYGVVRHRHTPEIEQICSRLAGYDVTVQFTPHLMPMVRGMLATVYATLRDPGLVSEDLLTIYKAFYRNAEWVKILPIGVYPQTKWAVGTNLCYLGIEVDNRTDRVIVMSAIDNLMKGQASQAIQCMNIMLDLPESMGLPRLAFYP